MKNRFFFLIVLTFFWQLPSFGSKSVVPFSCHLALETMAKNRRVEGTSENRFSFKDLNNGMTVISLEKGLIEIKNIVSSTREITFYRYGPRPGISKEALTQESFDKVSNALLGSQEARKIIQERINARFQNSKAIETYLVLAYLSHYNAIYLRPILEKFASTKSPATPHENYFRSLLLQLREWELVEQAIQTTRELVDYIYQETGENIYHSTVLWIRERLWENTEKLWPVNPWNSKSSDRQIDSGKGFSDTYDRNLKGNIVRIPQDIDLEVSYQLWQKHPTQKTGSLPYNFSAQPFYSLKEGAERAKHDPWSLSILDFKENPTEDDAKKLIVSATGLLSHLNALKETIPLQNLLLVPIPGSVSGKNPTSILTKQLGSIAGVAIHENLIVRSTASGSESQKNFPTLYQRWNNVVVKEGFKKAPRAKNIKDNVFVLVDDVNTTDTTRDYIRNLLLKEGAKAVYYISLGQSAD